jgi:UDP-N-acetyl-D-glucosamine dehydrogenase
LDGRSITSVTLTREMLQAADCVVITTPHSTYNWEEIVQNSKLVVDTRNATLRFNGSGARIVKL